MNESPIFVRMYDLLLWLIPQVVKFPRAHRFGLGERVTWQALDLQETLIAAGLRKGDQRQACLAQANTQWSVAGQPAAVQGPAVAHPGSV